mmetsp:Transcript_121781/g.351614  ORF Transcript_121781/g.351614 Transcript_121781/m.351614 type:complete len:185 (+) Transcript_121781:91-645(+)
MIFGTVNRGGGRRGSTASSMVSEDSWSGALDPRRRNEVVSTMVRPKEVPKLDLAKAKTFRPPRMAMCGPASSMKSAQASSWSFISCLPEDVTDDDEDGSDAVSPPAKQKGAASKAERSCMARSCEVGELCDERENLIPARNDFDDVHARDSVGNGLEGARIAIQEFLMLTDKRATGPRPSEGGV